MPSNPPKLSDLQLEYENAPSLLKENSLGKEWLDIPVEFRDGNWCHAAKPKVIEDLGFNNPRKWSPEDEDWQLQEGWQKTKDTAYYDILLNELGFQVFFVKYFLKQSLNFS